MKDINLSLLADNMSIFIKKSYSIYQKTHGTHNFKKITDYKVNIQKGIIILLIYIYSS